jgi:pSer/pThr/pTyr-binding forkhead associated (FHA) protein
MTTTGTETQVSGPIPLDQVAAAFSQHGSEGLTQLLGGDAPVLVLRTRSAENQVMFNTLPSSSHVPDRDRLDGIDETTDGRWPARGIGFVASSAVMPVTKSPRNPFLGLITVGRASNNDLRLPSPCVSKLHTILRQAAEGWKIQDSGSSNGTRVNGVKLEPKVDHWLNSGDDLLFGDTSCVFLGREGLQTFCKITRF